MNNMEQNQTKPKTSAKDLFINLGAIVALGTIVFSLINLLFTIINKAYPPIANYGYNNYSSSISWPVSILIIFFPIYILLMWLLERSYKVQPEMRNFGIRKWLTYITLFLSGLSIAGDLVTVIYYFIDGQELTTGFIMKILSVLVIALAIFFYYISLVMGKINFTSQKVWTVASVIIILGSIIWGFSVLGSPRTQQLIKYDQQKVSDLQSISSQISYYFESKLKLPDSLVDLNTNDYSIMPTDKQTNKPYEYKKTGDKTYELCALFNKPSTDNSQYNTYPTFGGDGLTSWSHPADRYCFSKTIITYPDRPKSIPAR